MADIEIKKSQNLIHLESLIIQLIGKQTNYAYSQNVKHSYRISFEKGTATLELQSTTSNSIKKVKDYYILEYFIIDKTEIIESKMILHQSFHPVEPLKGKWTLYEKALQDLIHNALCTLTAFGVGKQQMEVQEEKVKSNIITDVKPSLIIT